VSRHVEHTHSGVSSAAQTDDFARPSASRGQLFTDADTEPRARYARDVTTPSLPDLKGRCADLASELDDVSSESAGDFDIYRRGKVTFARVAAYVLEVRLPADIAEAAMRTSDTSAADERGWIRFSPSGRERHVTDRADAWFQTGWRHAVPTS
jgi:hypothetical protein